MSTLKNVATVLLIGAGAFFFIAGTVGLLRFPDLYTRIHAITKADNVGLGLIVLGLAVQSTVWTALAQLLVVWFLLLLSSASGAHLLARDAYLRGRSPWKGR